MTYDLTPDHTDTTASLLALAAALFQLAADGGAADNERLLVLLRRIEDRLIDDDAIKLNWD
jgi:hypothetical protein